MAHRLTFPANSSIPVALKLQVDGDGWFYPYDPAREDAVEDSVLSKSRIELLAVDATPLDRPDGETEDSLWLEAEFRDALSRTVTIRSHSVMSGLSERQTFGGVGINLYQLDTDEEGVPSGWIHKALESWAFFDVMIDGALVDAKVAGLVALSAPADGPEAEFTLQLTLHPETFEVDGATATPFQAARDVGMSGWHLEWEDVTYFQAPLLSARIERGDTIAKIAKDMSVDEEIIRRINPRFGGAHRLEAGDTLRVPILMGGATPVRKIHPSHALTWEEIVRGWTTLN